MKKLFFLLTMVMVVGTMTAQHYPGRHNPHNPPHTERHQPHHTPCATPDQMYQLMHTLKNQSFDDKRLEVAELCVILGSFCTDDLARMASTFTYDDKRLEFLKYAYPYCVDKEQYPRLHDCFTFRTNYDALIRYIYPSRKF